MTNLAHEEEFIGEESHIVPKVDPDDECNAKKTHNEKEDGETRTYFDGYCNNPAGKGTDHLGDGRCKWHGGNSTGGPGAPAHNQNAAKTHAHSDPMHYAESLDPDEEEFVEDTTAAILDRIRREQNREPDFLDRTLSRMVAIELHMFYAASEYSKDELVQVIIKDGSSVEKPGALVEEVRRFSNSIFSNLEKLDVFPNQENEGSTQLDQWLEIVEDQS